VEVPDTAPREAEPDPSQLDAGVGDESSASAARWIRFLPPPIRQSGFMEGVYPAPRIDQIEHLAAIRESRAHDYLYNCLSILDIKASALLQYDGLILAATTLVLTLFRTASIGTLLIVVALILSGFSAVLCLQVVWVYWTITADFVNPKEEFIDLLECRNKRTMCYRAAWLLAHASVFIFIIGIIIKEA
jgi:hypothetical protein